MQRVEFTIEPFVEGQPGSHVTQPIAAVRALGVEVEIGPFGTVCNVHDDRIAEVVSTIVGTALSYGATHVNLDIAAQPDERGDG